MTDIKKLIDGISDLPTLPSVVQKITQMVRDSSTSAGDINDVISRDQSLAAKVLKLVNSPFYGFPRRITTITYAVVILGFNTIRNLALSAFMFDAFKKKEKIFDLEAFWRHSICTAVAAQAIAKEIKHEQIEDAFMGGLLHDVGKAVMNQYLVDDFSMVCERVQNSDCLFLDAEQGVIDYDHAQVGAALMERWNLPSHMVTVVRCHHMPDQAGEEAQLTAVIHLADILARALLFGSGGDRRIPALNESAWATLGLTWAQVESLMESITDETRRADAFLEMA